VNEERELARIKGIGAARARWLEDTFGARTAAELARLSPDDIERELKTQGKVGVSRHTIESWLAEAGALFAATGNAETGTGPADPEWKSLASFVVDFQEAASTEVADPFRTSVHYLEKDRTETWPGIEHERLCAWMLGQLPKLAPPEETSEPPPESRETAQERAGPTAERFSAAIHINHSGAGVAPIPIHADWFVAFEWSVRSGADLGTGGEWRLDVLTQPLSQGAPPLRLRSGPVSISAHPQAKTYSERFDVAAGAVTPAHCGVPYRCLAVLTYRSPTSGQAHPAGFVELGELFFWHPGQRREATAAGLGLSPR
jgi:hypothetical protein